MVERAMGDGGRWRVERAMGDGGRWEGGEGDG